jgi:hypothetical protein
VAPHDFDFLCLRLRNVGGRIPDRHRCSLRSDELRNYGDGVDAAPEINRFDNDHLGTLMPHGAPSTPSL